MKRGGYLRAENTPIASAYSRLQPFTLDDPCEQAVCGPT